MFGLGFSAGIMAIIFVVITVGTGVAYWKMLTATFARQSTSRRILVICHRRIVAHSTTS